MSAAKQMQRMFMSVGGDIEGCDLSKIDVIQFMYGLYACIHVYVYGLYV